MRWKSSFALILAAGVAVTTFPPPFVQEAAAIEIECSDSTFMLTPIDVAEVQLPAQQAAQQSSSCQYHFGCIEPDAAIEGKNSCKHEGTTPFSWTSWGTYYCPPFGGGGICASHPNALPTDGTTRVTITLDGEVARTHYWVWDDGIRENKYAGPGTYHLTQADSVFASSYGYLSGAYGGWLETGSA